MLEIPLDAGASDGAEAGAHADASIARGGLNRAVYAAARALAAQGVRQMLAIPGDVPLIRAEEIGELFKAGAGTPVVLVPSASQTGTNGLLLSPPAVIAPQFEGASLAAHRMACATARVTCSVIALESFALDVDTVEDLETLARHEESRRSVLVARELLEARGADSPQLQRAGAQRS
jgi:2-phospho-L-lactate guanylyltransferase